MSGTGSRGGRYYRVADSTTITDLQRTLKKMGATNLTITQEYDPKPGAILSFDRAGRRYAFENRAFKHASDNLRAAQLCIESLWKAVELLGGSAMGKRLDDAIMAIFSGFEAVPGDRLLLIGTGVGHWWEILGLKEAASLAEIRNAYLVLARVYHTDNQATGNAHEFALVHKAYLAGKAKRGG